MTLLVAWVWQGIAIACAIAVFLRLRTVAAATRHAIWWVALAAVVLLPAGTVVQGLFARADVPLVPELAAAGSAVPLPAPSESLLAASAFAWLFLAAVGVLRIAMSVRALHRLKAGSCPAPAERLARLRMWKRTTRCGRTPEIRVSAAVSGACALGLGRPVILLSPRVLTLDDAALDAVVMHEQAHLVRFDDWTQLLECSMSALFWFHPAVWFICRQIQLEREAACDDLVLSRGALAREYARSLVEIARRTRVPRWHAVAVPGAVRSPSMLRRRVCRLLDGSRARADRARPRAAAGCAMVMIAAVALSAQAPSLVVFIETHVPAPPVTALVRATRSLTRPALPLPDASARRSAATPQAAPAPRQADSSATAQAAGEQPAKPSGEELTAMPLSPLQAPHSIAVSMNVVTPPASPRTGDTPTSPQAQPGPWTTFARSASTAGKATGNGARTAGSSIGRLFGRAGKAIADSF